MKKTDFIGSRHWMFCAALAALAVFPLQAQAGKGLVINPYPLQGQAKPATAAPVTLDKMTPMPSQDELQSPNQEQAALPPAVEQTTQTAATPKLAVLPMPESMQRAITDRDSAALINIEPAAGGPDLPMPPPDNGALGVMKITTNLGPEYYDQTGNTGFGGGFHAVPGSGLKETLSLWSRDADADLIWMPENDFVVLGQIDMQAGEYENAVQALLDQYQGQSLRPVGALHTGDTTDGRPVLVIQSTGTGG